MRLTLLVPGLLLPREVLTDTAFDLTAPALSRLLGRARRQPAAPNWLADAFGLAEVPAAACRKIGAGGTADGHWICLDPVHLQVGREGIALADPARLELTAAETPALLDAVAPLFADWGTLSASTPAHWELRLARPLDLATRPLVEAIGAPVDPALPGGTDGRAWRHLLAEAQTVLHAHPVNRQREALGQPTINSLWPWGAGALPERLPVPCDVVWSRDPVVIGLCAQAGLPCLPPPEGFQHASGHVLCIIDLFETPARTHNAMAWRQALQTFDERWLAPALGALKSRSCVEFHLVGTGSHGTTTASSYALSATDLLRFWRRPRPIVELA